MARMHARRKGKSGSTKPKEKKTPIWMRYKPKEIEKLIVKLAKAGKEAAEIGIFLRDTYGIPSVRVATGKRISYFLKENKLLKEIPDDLMALMKKSLAVRKHLEKNKVDKVSKRGLQLVESKIGRLVKYYKKSGRLPAEWKFEPEKVRMWVEGG